MRKSLKRAFALASTTSALAGLLSAGAPAAHAAIAPTCGTGATVLADFYVLGGFHTRIASIDASPTVKHVCIDLAGTLNTVVTINSGVSVTPPSVTQVAGTGRCAQPIIDMTAPVTLSLSVGVSTTGPSICLGQNGTTTTVSFNAASVQSLPDVDVWTTRYSWLNWLGPCADEWARYTVDSNAYYPWNACYSTDNKIV